jgi:hypothetical protein
LGYSVSFRTPGTRAFLFMTPFGSWLWNDDLVRPLDMLMPCTYTSIFDVETTTSRICISDVLVYKNRSLIGRCYLERMEAARKWMHLYTDPKTLMDGDGEKWSFRSAYPSYQIEQNGTTITVKNLYPAGCRHELWMHRPSSINSTGLLFTRLLDRYRPYTSPGTLSWTPKKNS